jgi:hypothetical protein
LEVPTETVEEAVGSVAAAATAATAVTTATAALGVEGTGQAVTGEHSVQRSPTNSLPKSQ